MLRRAIRDQRVAYVAVGALNTALGLGVFTALYLLAGEELGYLGALLLTYLFGILLGFALFRSFVFRVGGPVLPDLARYTSVQVGALALNAGILPFAVEVVDAPVLPAQVISLALTVVISYVLHRGFTFRRTSAPS